MCGRFIITKELGEITARFHVDAENDIYSPVYNAAPTQRLPVITNAEPATLHFYRWGLIPSWAKDPTIGNKMINARSETLFEKPAFSKLIRSKRCLVIADGFYEWKKTGKEKTPYRICLDSEDLFTFAGLWDTWKDAEGKALNTFTIITTSPNELMNAIHSRMPVILKREDELRWLSKDLSTDELNKIMLPFDTRLMKAHPVSALVNSTQNNRPELIKPVEL